MSKKFVIEKLNHLTTLFGEERVARGEVTKGEATALALESFGDAPGAFAQEDGFFDTYDMERFEAPPPELFRLRSVNIYTPFQLMLIDEVAVRESVAHFPYFRFPDYKFEGERHRETTLAIPDREVSLDISSAYSMSTGYHQNYYHWMIMGLGRIGSVFLEHDFITSASSRPVLLFPYFFSTVQAESAAIVAEHYGLSYISIKRPVGIRVESLYYPQPLRAGGLRPHSVILNSFNIIRDKFGPSYDGSRSIYVSRRDTNKRKMSNEAEIEAFLGLHGFEVISLTGLTLQQQVAIFASARRIISPHGAGLTNIGFCQPDTKLLEIHMPTYPNWCYRRLAAVRGMRYGYVWGDLELADPQNPSHKTYSVKTETLRRALDAGF